MFRQDKCTIRRPEIININGEDIHNADVVIYRNIPCHLSVKAISPVMQTQLVANVLYDYTLFIDVNSGVDILPNDLIEVTTHAGKVHNLRAGESQTYNMTIQTHCEVNKIV